MIIGLHSNLRTVNVSCDVLVLEMLVLHVGCVRYFQHINGVNGVIFGFLKSFLVLLECSFFVCEFCPTLVRYGKVFSFIYGKMFKVLNKFRSNEAMLWCFAP